MPALASALLVLAVKESPRPLLDRRALLPRGAGATASAVRRLVRPPAGTGPGFRRVAAVLVGFGFVDVPDALLLLHLNEVGFGVAAVILAYVGYNAVYALASYPAGALADRLGPRRVFGLGLVFFAVAYVGLGLTGYGLLPWLLLAVYGLFAALTDGVGKALGEPARPSVPAGRGAGVRAGRHRLRRARGRRLGRAGLGRGRHRSAGDRRDGRRRARRRPAGRPAPPLTPRHVLRFGCVTRLRLPFPAQKSAVEEQRSRRGARVAGRPTDQAPASPSTFWMRFSDTGYAVPSCCAKKLTRSSSIIQRTPASSGPGAARRQRGERLVVRLLHELDPPHQLPVALAAARAARSSRTPAARR